MKSGSVFWRLFLLILPAWPAMLAACLLGLTTVGANVGLMATAAYLLSAAALHPTMDVLYLPVVGVRFFGLLRAAARYFERYVSHDATFRLLATIRSWVYGCLEPLAPSGLTAFRSGEIFSRAVNDVETLKFFYLRVLFPPLVAILVLMAVSLWLSLFGTSFVVLLSAGFFAVGVILPLALCRFGPRASSQLPKSRALLTTRLVDSVRGMRDLASFSQTERQTRLVKSASDDYSQLQNQTAAHSGLGNALGNLIANLTLVGALLLAIPLIRSGHLDGIMLAAVALGIQSSFEAVLPMTAIHHYQQEAYAAGRRLFAIADTKPPVAFDFSREIFLPQDGFSLSVHNLRFRYQDNSPWVLDDISFDLPVGGRLAIVGPSGAGKSSLANILLRLGEYSEGQILLGGTELRHIHPEALRKNCGLLLQNDHLFNATLAENLRLANPAASDEELLAAINKAGLGSVLDSLPHGLDTWLGENGSALSGGERRRVSIARILLKNSPLLILDEPAAGLDSISERQIMASINSLMSGKSTILITHRLTGLESMNEILVLDQGKIAERGRLDDLIAAKSLFYSMWRLQNDLIPEN